MIDVSRITVPPKFLENIIKPACQGDSAILEAFRTVPRQLFVDEAMVMRAYTDNAQPIGYGQTISQPSLVAMMLYELEIEKTHKCLEVGAGSGFACALMGKLADEVYSVELLPELSRQAQQKIRTLKLRNVAVITSNGSVGYADKAPYDRILVSAGGRSVPAPLVEQLAEEGIMVIPVNGILTKVVKKDGQTREKPLARVAFVDFVGS